MSRSCETLAVRRPFGAAAMRIITLIALGILSGTTETSAAMGFDEKYERDYNSFTPANRYASNNPLNPVNKYDMDSVFNPINRYDPGNPTNPINQYNPNNPFNPANKYNSNVQFGPWDGIVRSSR